MSPADTAAVNHIATDLRDMSDADLNRLARKNACLPGVNAAAVRHAIHRHDPIECWCELPAGVRFFCVYCAAEQGQPHQSWCPRAGAL